MSRWDEFNADDPREITRDTTLAHERVLELARDQLGDAFEYGLGGATLRLRIPERRPDLEPRTMSYVVEVRGQSSATAHGMHGANPERLAALRELDEPVLLLFVETGANVFYAGWLEELPEAHRISTDPVAKRQGWRCRELSRYEGTFEFPRAVFAPLATPEEPAPARLG